MLEAVSGTGVGFSVLKREEATVTWDFETSLVLLSGDAVVKNGFSVLIIEETVVAALAVTFVRASLGVTDVSSDVMIFVVSTNNVGGVSVLNMEETGVVATSAEPSSSVNNDLESSSWTVLAETALGFSVLCRDEVTSVVELKTTILALATVDTTGFSVLNTEDDEMLVGEGDRGPFVDT